MADHMCLAVQVHQVSFNAAGGASGQANNEAVAALTGIPHQVCVCVRVCMRAVVVVVVVVCLCVCVCVCVYWHMTPAICVV